MLQVKEYKNKIKDKRMLIFNRSVGIQGDLLSEAQHK